MALLEPFIDTIVICTMTGLVIIMTGVWHDRIPTEITLGGGDITYVAVARAGGQRDGRGAAGDPARRGRARSPDAVHLGWHDTTLDDPVRRSGA